MEIMRRLSMLWPDAAWLRSTCAELRQAADALVVLRSGPLGLVAGMPLPVDSQETLPMPEQGEPDRHDNAMAPHPPGAGPLRERIVLHVDGVGSFQVIERAVVTVGPVGSSAAADVPILAGADVRPLTITRTDGDYLLQCGAAVQVNDKPTTGRLLSGGDKVAIGPRCRFAFRRPSAASGTAILDLTGARLPRGDVRQVILMDREILIGPGAGAHVRCDTLAQAAVLRRQGDKWSLRCPEPLQVDGRVARSPAEVAAGAHVRLGTVSFVIAKG
jgi:hypothetical protein